MENPCLEGGVINKSETISPRYTLWLVCAAYYNEIEPYCVEWLKCLIRDGLIADGEVDPRPIQQVLPEDLKGFRQCHFFAGIGGWSYAARLAGVPDDFRLWTGSCPCQPFSVAGKKRGVEDERHLWPEFLRLINQCKPTTVFGEQVASKDGRVWLAGVRSDMEALAYAVGGADLCAAGVGAPHIRQRLYWLAKSHDTGSQGLRILSECGDKLAVGESGVDSRLAHSGQELRRSGSSEVHREAEAKWSQEADNPERYSMWGNYVLVGPDPNGSCRRSKPGVRMLAHGVPGRVGKLRAYGNAIVPQVAAEFIQASLESISGR